MSIAIAVLGMVLFLFLMLILLGYLTRRAEKAEEERLRAKGFHAAPSQHQEHERPV